MQKIKLDYTKFAKQLEELLKDRPHHTKEKQKKFVVALEKSIPEALIVYERCFPESKQIRDIEAHAERFLKSAEMLLNCKKREPHFNTLDTLVGEEMRLNNKLPIVLEDICDYADILKNYINGIRGASSRSGPSNKLPLVICIYVSKLYESFFKLKPTSNSGDFSQQSGDLMDSTPYERICFLLSKFLNIKITWHTTKQALNSEGITFMQAQ